MSFLSLSISFSLRPSPSFPLLLQFPLPLPHFPLYTGPVTHPILPRIPHPLNLLLHYPDSKPRFPIRLYFYSPLCIVCVLNTDHLCVCVFLYLEDFVYRAGAANTVRAAQRHTYYCIATT